MNIYILIGLAAAIMGCALCIHCLTNKVITKIHIITILFSVILSYTLNICGFEMSRQSAYNTGYYDGYFDGYHACRDYKGYEYHAIPDNATNTTDSIPTYHQYYTEVDVIEMSKAIYGEARGCKTTAEKAAVGWCILNRYNSGNYNSITDVIIADSQFIGYSPDNPEHEYLGLARDVLNRWQREIDGYSDVGRTLPAEYKYFLGDGVENHFTTEWKGSVEWDWSLPDPYAG